MTEQSVFDYTAFAAGAVAPGSPAGSLLAQLQWLAGQGGVPAQKRMAVTLLDSITAGYGLADPGGQAWPAQLAPQVAATYGLVVNKAVSGNTTQLGLQRMADIVSAYNFVDYAGVDVFVLGGINNIIHNNDSVATLEQQYTELVTQLKAPNPAKVRVFILTLPACTATVYNTPAATITPRVNDVNAAIRANAVSGYGAAGFIDLARRLEMQNADDATYFYDKLHPTAAGNAIIADTVADFVADGTQPSGPIISNPGGGSGAAVWSAPASGTSSEYDVALPEWIIGGNWIPNYDGTFWADNSGKFSNAAGQTYTSPTLETRSVYVENAVNSNSGIGLYELIRASDDQVMDSAEVNMTGTPGRAAPFLLTTPAVGVYYFRLTHLNTAPGNVYLSGIRLTRSAS